MTRTYDDGNQERIRQLEVIRNDGGIGKDELNTANLLTSQDAKGRNELPPFNGVEKDRAPAASALTLAPENILLELGKDCLGVKVGVAPVDALEVLLGFCIASFGDKPARGLGEEPDEGDLEDGGDDLEDGRDTPAPVGGHLERAERDPGCDDRTDEPGGVEERAHTRALLGVRELADHGGRSYDRKGDTETEKEARDDEHRDCVGALKLGFGRRSGMGRQRRTIL